MSRYACAMTFVGSVVMSLGGMAIEQGEGAIRHLTVGEASEIRGGQVAILCDIPAFDTCAVSSDDCTNAQQCYWTGPGEDDYLCHEVSAEKVQQLLGLSFTQNLNVPSTGWDFVLGGLYDCAKCFDCGCYERYDFDYWCYPESDWEFCRGAEDEWNKGAVCPDEE